MTSNLQLCRFNTRSATALIQRMASGAWNEPDESCNLSTQKPCPDLVIEVINTSGGIDRLGVSALGHS